MIYSISYLESRWNRPVYRALRKASISGSLESRQTGRAAIREHDVARCYFHLKNGDERLLDPEGQQIENPGRIAEIALKEVRSIISQDALRGEIDLDQRPEVEDESGKLVYSLPFADAVRIIPGRQ